VYLHLILIYLYEIVTILNIPRKAREPDLARGPDFGDRWFKILLAESYLLHGAIVTSHTEI